ncbi:hypothetical protein BCR34DRAFT_502268, partial [Clohesyomyces aquaticus]
HLSTGGTTKARNRRQAGQHGEGLKRAALVFRRHPNNYNFKIESSEFRGYFHLNMCSKLQYRLTRVNENTVRKERRATLVQSRTTVVHIWEDVLVVIGASGTSRGPSRLEGKGKKIPIARFRE